MNPQHNLPDPLDNAILALRDAHLPSGPPPQLIATTVDAVQRESQPLLRRLHMPNTRYRELIAATLLLGFVGWMLVSEVHTKVAFARVAEKVQAVKSVRFKIA